MTVMYKYNALAASCVCQSHYSFNYKQLMALDQYPGAANTRLLLQLLIREGEKKREIKIVEASRILRQLLYIRAQHARLASMCWSNQSPGLSQNPLCLFPVLDDFCCCSRSWLKAASKACKQHAIGLVSLLSFRWENSSWKHCALNVGLGFK